ncbi:hypothetical protein F6T63_14100 [Citrobacter freundii]|nr:hypothetical protein [Citrobacter freundii]QFH77068.1 hypothetical protein FR753_21505 [Citrobacter freundii]QFH81443.1 hypothetical protein FR815_17205 [Citrobacter freundii]HAU4308713.1 hypothetical protein [Citrobacter freundii]
MLRLEQCACGHLHQVADELADIAHMLQTFEVTGSNGGVSHARTSATGSMTLCSSTARSWPPRLHLS